MKGTATAGKHFTSNKHEHTSVSYFTCPCAQLTKLMSLSICPYASCTKSMKMKVYIGIYTCCQEHDMSFPSIHGKPCFTLSIKTDNNRYKLGHDVEKFNYNHVSLHIVLQNNTIFFTSCNWKIMQITGMQIRHWESTYSGIKWRSYGLLHCERQ